MNSGDQKINLYCLHKLTLLEVETRIETISHPLLSSELYLHSETLGQVEPKHWGEGSAIWLLLLFVYTSIKNPLAYLVISAGRHI